MAEATATFNLNLEGNASKVSDEAAKSLEAFRSAIKSSQDKLREYSETLSTLKGKSDEVTDARSKLKAAMDKERVSIASASLQISKLGSTYGALSAKAKAAGKDQPYDALQKLGGPLAKTKDHLSELSKAFSGANGGAVLFAGSLAIVAIAVAAVAAAVVAGTVALGKWILESADAARTLQLVREAATGSAENAKNLGTQVDALSRKVPTSKKELNDLAAEMYRTFNNTQATGQTIVDTFNLVAQTSASMGATVGKQLGDIIERGKRFNRVQINPFELQGTGIKFQDVAAQLAKQLNVSIGQAQKALFEGRVKLDAGAAALRAAVEKRFGDINTRKMLSFDNLRLKAQETFASLTAGVNLDPLGRTIQSIFRMFDPATKEGKAIKEIVTLIGNGLVKAFVKLAPIAKGAFYGIAIGAVDVAIIVLRLGVAIENALGLKGARSFLTIENAATAAKFAVYSFAAVAAVGAAAVLILASPIIFVVYSVMQLKHAVQDLAAWWKGFKWSTLGTAIVDGLVGGLKSGYERTVGAVKGLADGVAGTFKSVLKIGSPSKVFQGYGEDTGEGYAQGLEGSKGRVQDAASGMAPSGPGGGGGGRGRAGGGGMPLQITVNIAAAGAKQSDVTSKSFLSDLTHAIEHAIKSAGIPAQTAPT
jgi:peptidoglycan hydrolase CwlO-like protein